MSIDTSDTSLRFGSSSSDMRHYGAVQPAATGPSRAAGRVNPKSFKTFRELAIFLKRTSRVNTGLAGSA